MSNDKPTCKCQHCGQTVTFHYEPVNHRQHMWLTLFTLGLWSPMWLFDVVAKVKICDACGKSVRI